jgi:hypothetical protein
MKRIWILVLVLSASPALAIDFTQPLKFPDGTISTDCVKFKSDSNTPKCEIEVPMTLGRLIVAALGQPQKGASIPEIRRDGKLADRIMDAKDAQLSNDEISRIKTKLAEAGINTLIVSRALEIIDPTVDK